MREYLSKTGVDEWNTVEYMPILMDSRNDEKELYVSKINYMIYFNHIQIFEERIKRVYAFHKYDISKNVRIILPNGDISDIGYDNSIILGNILKDDKERIDKNFKNRQIKIIPRKKDEKIRVLISNESQKAINEIRRQVEKLEYVEVVETCKLGKDTFEKIIELKPEMAFIQYEYKDLPNTNIIADLKKELDIEFPCIILSFKEYNQQVRHKAFNEADGKLNRWNCNNKFRDDEFTCMIKEYKSYRDWR